MFNSDELLKIFKVIDDAIIKEKIESMVFVDNALTAKILERFEGKGLLKIEKSTDSNQYYIHFEKNNYDLCDSIEALVKMAYDSKTEHTWAELNPIEHNKISEMWWHGDMTQVWTREDVEAYWKDK